MKWEEFFYIDCEEDEPKEEEPSQDEDIQEATSEKITPTISCHALDGIVTPLTLKIEGYIKKKKVTVLIDSDSINKSSFNVYFPNLLIYLYIQH